MQLFFLLFVLTPLIELYVLIEVGGAIGGLPTIAMCLATAAIGGFLVRSQGLATLTHARRELHQGHVPAESAVHGLLLALAGVLLLTPGFVTDAIGFALLVPAWRRRLIGMLLPQPGGGRGWIEAEIIDTEERRLP